jgi:glycerophosphoryl diester phosphodiesterase
MLVSSFVHAIIKCASIPFERFSIVELGCVDAASASVEGDKAVGAVLEGEKLVSSVVDSLSSYKQSLRGVRGRLSGDVKMITLRLLAQQEKVVAQGHVLIMGDGVRSRRFEQVALVGDDGKLVGEARVMIVVALEWNGTWTRPPFHWPKHNECVMIGHRGFGASKERKGVAENTLLAFRAAFETGLFRWVEFDVQLTSDRVAVIFHDDRVPLALSQTNGVNSAPLVPVSEFDLHHFQSLSHSSRLPRARRTSSDHIGKVVAATPATEVTINDSFPTLREVLKRSPKGLNFNVELKFSELRIGTEGIVVNRGLLVDVVLSDVSKYAGDRGILFSSFDPDVCFIVKEKQKQYPVLFLTEGAHVVADDPRQNSLEAAIEWAVLCGLGET